jgi:hypothetical protein
MTMIDDQEYEQEEIINDDLSKENLPKEEKQY